GHDLPSASGVARRRRIFPLIRLLLAPWLRTESLCRNGYFIHLRALTFPAIARPCHPEILLEMFFTDCYNALFETDYNSGMSASQPAKTPRHASELTVEHTPPDEPSRRSAFPGGT
ncbi:MAG: hypothetical protein ABIF71_09145, partial [Planctomycetota bacterium]